MHLHNSSLQLVLKHPILITIDGIKTNISKVCISCDAVLSLFTTCPFHFMSINSFAVFIHRSNIAFNRILLGITIYKFLLHITIQKPCQSET